MSGLNRWIWMSKLWASASSMQSWRLSVRAVRGLSLVAVATGAFVTAVAGGGGVVAGGCWSVWADAASARLDAKMAANFNGCIKREECLIRRDSSNHRIVSLFISVQENPHSRRRPL